MSLKVFSLKNKRALITGGATGIGFGISKAFVEAGAKVVITGRNEEKLRKTVDALGSPCQFLVNDITEKRKIPALIKQIENEIGPIDVLVNNAGIHHKAWAVDTSDADFERILQTNLMSVFSISRECIKYMKKRQSGSILMISSMTALFGIDRVVAYSVSKTALTGLVNTLTVEHAKDNIRINVIAPGWIASDMFHKAINADEARKQQIVNRIAMPGFGKPEDIGNAAVFLSSEAARYITGVILPVDGGATVNF